MPKCREHLIPSLAKTSNLGRALDLLIRHNRYSIRARLHRNSPYHNRLQDYRGRRIRFRMDRVHIMRIHRHLRRLTPFLLRHRISFLLRFQPICVLLLAEHILYVLQLLRLLLSHGLQLLLRAFVF